MFIVCLNYVPQTLTNLIKENSFIFLKKTKNRRYPTETMRDADYVDDLALLINTRSLLRRVGASSKGPFVST